MSHISPIVPSVARDLPTACCLCSHNCGLRVDVLNRKISAIRPDLGNPITRGYICQKGYSIAAYIEHRQRLASPLRRSADGVLEPTSWDQALGEICARLGDIRDRYSPNAIALVGTGGQGNHMDALSALSFFQGLGSPWWFTAFAQEKTQHVLVDSWMVGSPPSAYLVPDAERSRCIIMIGTNPLLSHRGRCPRDLVDALGRDPERTLIVVDPRRTETAARAKIHLPIKPGSDCYLLLWLCAEIVRRGLHDTEFLGHSTKGYEEVAALLQRVDVAEMAARTDLCPDDVVRVAITFATARPASLFFDLGAEQTPFSTLNAYLIRVLSALTGNLGRPGGNVYTCAPLAPNFEFMSRFPRPRAAVSRVNSIPILGPIGGFSPNLLPEEICSPAYSRIRAVIVEGANPLLSYADSKYYREAFKRLDLLVVIDPALTETAQEAHFVLPAPVGYEKWEWSAFPNGYPEVYAQVRPPILSPLGAALPEPEIFFRLATGMNLVPDRSAVSDRLVRGAHSGGASALLYQALCGARGAARLRSVGGALASITFSAYRDIGAHLPSPALANIWILSHLFALTNRDDVTRALGPTGAGRPSPTLGGRLFQLLMDHPGGVEIARLDISKNLETFCRFPENRIQLNPVEMILEAQKALSVRTATLCEFPMVLFTGERLFWNSNTIHRDPSWRKGSGPHCTLRIHPVDAAMIGVATGENVRVETRTGFVELPCRVDDRMQVGHVSIPHGFGQRYPDPDTGVLVEDGVNVNVLTSVEERDPFTGVPYHKFVRCRVQAACVRTPRA